MTDLPASVGVASRPGVVVAVVAAELALIAVVFQFAVDFDCRASGAYGACMAVRNSLGRAIALAAVALLVPALRRSLAVLPRRTGAAGPWPLVQAAGVAMILAPALAAPGDFAGTFRASLVPWAAGAVLATLGTLFWIAEPAAWRRSLTPGAALAVAAALAAPEALAGADRLWSGTALADLTFAGAAWLLAPFGAVESDPARRVLGLDGFAVEVAGPCSGLEGCALIAAFLAAHLWIERRSLRFPHALVLVPLGLLASLALNALRIALLVWVGARVSPQLAVDGFHSHAGWLAFTLLALGLVALSRRLPWLARPAGPRAADTATGLVLPFVAAMLASLATATFAPDPAAWYPARAAVAAAVLAATAAARPALGRPGAVAVVAGLGIGLAWQLTAAAAPVAAPGAAWAAARLAGAVLVTPFVEELFFRGYLLARLDRGGWTRALALAVSSGLFALLHDRWLAAFVSGVGFGLVFRRRGRLGDAAAAHAAANAVLAAAALLTGDWSAF